MSADPWAHRSAGMSCATCMWFVQKEPWIKIVAKGKKDDALAEVATKLFETLQPVIGRCRRHAPKLGGYPVVFSHDWCGDHKLDKTKI